MSLLKSTAYSARSKTLFEQFDNTISASRSMLQRAGCRRTLSRTCDTVSESPSSSNGQRKVSGQTTEIDREKRSGERDRETDKGKETDESARD